jgi:hypothetical protein
MSANSKNVHHYTNGIECWDYIVSQDLGYLAGNVIKYVTRYRHKGTPIQDLEKAQHYLAKLIEVEKEKQRVEGILDPGIPNMVPLPDYSGGD